MRAGLAKKEPSTRLVLKWENPDRGWFKLNTDGTSTGNPSKPGVGGLIRERV